jgi:hypothetical protein
MSAKPVNLEIIDSSLNGDVRDKLAKFISPIFELKKSLTEEFYLSLNTDYRHILKQSQSNILNFAMNEFGWQDIYDVDLFSITIKKKYDTAIKTSLKDTIDVDTNYFYQHYIIIKLSPAENFFFAIIGKRLKDVLHMEDAISKKASDLEKTFDERQKYALDEQNKKYAKLQFDLENITITTQKLKEQVTKELEEKFNMFSAAQSSQNDELVKLRQQLSEFATTFTTTLANATNELKAGYESKLNIFNEKLQETATNLTTVTSAQSEQQKSLESVKSSNEQKFLALEGTFTEQNKTLESNKVEFETKFSQLKSVLDTNFHTLKSDTETKLTELRGNEEKLKLENDARLGAVEQGIKSQIALLSEGEKNRYTELTNLLNTIRKDFVDKVAELKGFIGQLDVNVRDLESKVFPNGKDMIRQ